MDVAVLMDDPGQALIAEQTVRMAGYTSVRFSDGKALMLALRSQTFGLILLDADCRGIDARDVMLWTRSTLGNQPPLLIAGVPDDEGEVVSESLMAGADAWIDKPLRHRELSARIEALLRDVDKPLGGSDIAIGRYRIAASNRRAFLDDAAVRLSPKEFDLALLFFRNVGELIRRKTIMKAVWARPLPPESRTLESHLSRIRQKLFLGPPTGLRLVSVYRAGFRLEVLGPDAVPLRTRDPDRILYARAADGTRRIVRSRATVKLTRP